MHEYADQEIDKCAVLFAGTVGQISRFIIFLDKFPKQMRQAAEANSMIKEFPYDLLIHFQECLEYIDRRHDF